LSRFSIERIVVLDRGRIAADGPPAATITMLGRVFGVAAAVSRPPPPGIPFVLPHAIAPLRPGSWRHPSMVLDPGARSERRSLQDSIRLFYATRDGQSRRIAERIAARLAESNISVPPVDLAAAAPAAADLRQARLVAVVAAVRYGRHLPEALQFFDVFRSLPAPPPLCLVSVNLTARKPGKNSAAGNPYLRKLIERYGLRPAVAAAIGGRLDYARYRWWDRQIIRFIMMLTGGPTDPTSCVDYASPDAIDAIASDIVRLYRAAGSRAACD
jgi:menaquinone-dependent protoporphyrinogen oxidase